MTQDCFTLVSIGHPQPPPASRLSSGKRRFPSAKSNARTREICAKKLRQPRANEVEARRKSGCPRTTTPSACSVKRRGRLALTQKRRHPLHPQLLRRRPLPRQTHHSPRQHRRTLRRHRRRRSSGGATFASRPSPPSTSSRSTTASTQVGLLMTSRKSACHPSGSYSHSHSL